MASPPLRGPVLRTFDEIAGIRGGSPHVRTCYLEPFDSCMVIRPLIQGPLKSPDIVDTRY